MRYRFYVNGPKIIVFDIETIPNLAKALEVWPRLSDYPGKTMKATITSVACVGYKQLGEKKVHCVNAWDFSRWKRDVNDDKSVLLKIYSVLKDADAVITHNGKRFDWKFLQTRFLMHGMPPLKKTPHIDTVQLARSNIFAFSNRLGDLGKMLLSEEKLAHDGWQLWVDTYNKKPDALKKMSDYCIQDVLLLEKLYEKLKPFAKNIPNFNIFDKESGHCCPSCGSKKFHKRGTHLTKVKTYQRYQCQKCASWFRTDLYDYSPRSI